MQHKSQNVSHVDEEASQKGVGERVLTYGALALHSV